MSRRLVIRPEAEGDLTEAALWYEEREAGLGREFTREVGAAMARAMGNPPVQLALGRVSRVADPNIVTPAVHGSPVD